MTTITTTSTIGRRAGAALLGLALAACAGSALAQDARERVNVYQYAVDHPRDDAKMNGAPSLGASVPQTVELATVEGDKDYGYFYYDGRPVLVDLRTRSVVRIEH